MIHFRHVTKSYGEIKALDDINLKINQGEFVFLIGPSGAGKSTLLKHIYMDERPDLKGGQVLISYTKKDVYDSKLISTTKIQYFRRKQGIIFQDFKLLRDRNVYDNIAFTLEINGYTPIQIKQRIHDVMSQVGISHRRNAFPQSLSGGEAQRVAIARAMVHDPYIVIADEPTGNLDPENAKHIFDLLKLINSRGATVIMATHNPKLYESSPFRRIILEGGRIRNRDIL